MARYASIGARSATSHVGQNEGLRHSGACRNSFGAGSGESLAAWSTTIDAAGIAQTLMGGASRWSSAHGRPLARSVALAGGFCAQ